MTHTEVRQDLPASPSLAAGEATSPTAHEAPDRAAMVRAIEAVHVAAMLPPPDLSSRSDSYIEGMYESLCGSLSDRLAEQTEAAS